jgi:hypothetical protein
VPCPLQSDHELVELTVREGVDIDVGDGVDGFVQPLEHLHRHARTLSNWRSENNS